MEWTDDKVLELIEEYKARPVLWDPTSADYKLLNKKSDSWKSLAAVMTTDVEEVKKKINSLLSSFRRERTKENKKSGMAANEVYKSNWFAYAPMAFLKDKFKVNDTKSSEEKETAYGTEVGLGLEPSQTKWRQTLNLELKPSVAKRQ
ncbi:uncharacterized protein LOC129000544 [Macrosteles quadrilineatus]|uniref:uncharacterized protein LOC129000544 n=1 Tax=Macrosteles quadrilineatus TaxID=74068 RepID=UPI0023E26F45|nr:uncharacterized protein LOC129000544 [Macrosteles quadrilineatus]